MKAKLLLAGKLLLFAFFIALAVRLLKDQDLSVLAERPGWVASAVLGLAGTQILCAWRLYFLFRRMGVSLPFREAFRLVGLSFLAGSVFPGILGQDGVKFAALRWLDRDSKLEKLLTILFVDRLMGMAAIFSYAFLLSFFVAPAGADGAGVFRTARLPLLIFLPAVVALSAGAKSVLDRLPAGVRAKVETLSFLLSSPEGRRAAFGGWGIGMLSMGVLLLTQGGIGVSLHGLLAGPSGLEVHAFLATVTVVLSALPIAPAGIGVGQAVLQRLYEWFGLAPSAGLLVITVMQAGQVIGAVALGAAAWALRGGAGGRPVPAAIGAGPR